MPIVLQFHLWFVESYDCLLLQNATDIITKCDSFFITKCNSFITKCDNLRQYSQYPKMSVIHAVLIIMLPLRLQSKPEKSSLMLCWEFLNVFWMTNGIDQWQILKTWEYFLAFDYLVKLPNNCLATWKPRTFCGLVPDLSCL